MVAERKKMKNETFAQTTLFCSKPGLIPGFKNVLGQMQVGLMEFGLHYRASRGRSRFADVLFLAIHLRQLLIEGSSANNPVMSTLSWL